MRITPTPLTAALAGLFTGALMPWLWPRLGEDTLNWIVAFLLVIALPAHALVVGFGPRAVEGGTTDKGLPRRVAAWLATAIATFVLVQALAI